MSFKARWSPGLVFVSALVTLVCILVGVLSSAAAGWIGALVLAMPLVALLFAVLGYRVDGDTLLIRRPLWITRVSLAGLRSASADPQLVRRSWRTFGNGGFFSVSGWFYNKTLGKYRAWVTSRTDIVVLKFDDRVLVISPHPPDEFVQLVSTRISSGG